MGQHFKSSASSRRERPDKRPPFVGLPGDPRAVRYQTLALICAAWPCVNSAVPQNHWQFELGLSVVK